MTFLKWRLKFKTNIPLPIVNIRGFDPLIVKEVTPPTKDFVSLHGMQCEPHMCTSAQALSDFKWKEFKKPVRH